MRDQRSGPSRVERRSGAMEQPCAPQRVKLRVEVVLLLREVLNVEVERRVDELADIVGSPPIDPAELTGPLARLDGERALLDEIGWSVPEHQQPLEIDFASHGQTIADALDTDLDTQRYLADTDDAVQRERATATVALIQRFLAEVKSEHDAARGATSPEYSAVR